MIKIIIAFLFNFILSIIIGLLFIPLLKKINVSQRVSHHLNERHLKKDGTPTMGGIIFIIPPLLFFALAKIKLSYNLIIIILVFLFYGLIGFIDDFLKIFFKNNKGLSIITKFLFEIIIALIFFFLFIYAGNNTIVNIFNINVDLKCLYGLLILFMLSGCSNAVNITDGLDGLAAGCTFISFLTYGIIALYKPYILSNYEIALFCFSLCGSLIGFLFFNFYPAKVFMGDLGSLSLGALLASIAIVLKCEISLIFIGIIYVFETITSFIQIISIKFFHKKIFLKSPFHHHLEEKGLSETEILKIFYIISLLSSFIYLIYYIK